VRGTQVATGIITKGSGFSGLKDYRIFVSISFNPKIHPSNKSKFRQQFMKIL
jgi:hypothetical protein